MSYQFLLKTNNFRDIISVKHTNDHLEHNLFFRIKILFHKRYIYKCLMVKSFHREIGNNKKLIIGR
nr:MAG TPA: hypothetical protein [Caudoviricetes sp.]